MGIRFDDLQSLNWLAYLLEHDRTMPRLLDPFMERRVLEGFLRKLETNFVSSDRGRRRVLRAARSALERLDNISYGEAIPDAFLEDLRTHLEIGPWAALIVPSRSDSEINEFLSSDRFLNELVRDEHWPDSGIVLQPSGGALEMSGVIIDVFPAFRHALSRPTEWPGMLFWTPKGEAVFLPFGSKNFGDIRRRAGWMLSHLSTSKGMTLQDFQKEYWKAFSDAKLAKSATVTLLQLSDLHIGSLEASNRLGRLQQIVRNVLRELPEGSTIIPVVTGDIMDDPNIKAYDEADRFFDFLHNLNTEEPLVVLGNHDVRRDGHLEVDLGVAIRFKNEPIRWFDSQKLGFACFNSTMEAKSKHDLATGKIGERQFDAMGTMIDRKKDAVDYLLIGLLHHHPIPVKRPEWYKAPFYERVFGKLMESTVKLRDAKAFNRFVSDRKFSVVMHGHEHIPRVDEIKEGNDRRIAIVGCGSSVGKVRTRTDEIYVSINVVSINRQTSQMAARLLAQRVSGGLLETTHEYISEIL